MHENIWFRGLPEQGRTRRHCFLAAAAQYARHMTRRKWIILAGAAVTLLFVSCGGLVLLSSKLDGTLNSQWYPWNVSRSKHIGDQLVHALDSYNQRQGHYPASLDELVPRDIATIQPPTAGRKLWSYRIDSDAHDFTLGFEDENASVPRWYFESYARRWFFKSF